MNENILYWEDIDFSIIKKGMITAGPAEVSMAEYLTTFLETLRFRTDFFEASAPFIKFTSFTTGDIRRAKVFDGNLTGGDFREVYGKMIYVLYTLIDNRDFYSDDVIFDAVNADDYILPKPDDEEFLEFVDVDQGTVDLFINALQEPHYKIFTAKMLRLLYQVLSLYTISKKDIGVNRVGNTIIPIEDNTLTRDVREFWRGFGSFSNSEDVAEDDWSKANTGAYDEYTSNGLDKGKSSNRTDKIFNADNQISYRRFSIDSVIFSNFEDSTAQYRSSEGYVINSNYKNKDDIFVDVQFSMHGILNENHSDVTAEQETDNSPSPNTIVNKNKDDGPFIIGYPRVIRGGVPEIINIDNLKAPSQLGDDGILSAYSLSSAYPVDFMPKEVNPDDDGGLNGADFGNFERIDEAHITSPQFVYADSNSFGFDYFMEPDLFPPLED